MGWTGTYRQKGTSDKAFFEREWNLAEQDKEIVACNSAGGFGGQFYAAIRDNATGLVSAVVVLKRWSSNDYWNFSYKTIDENAGPGDYKASAAVLSSLTPTENGWATEWRDQVVAFHASRADRPKTMVGDIIQFENVISFQNGHKTDTFQIRTGGVLAYADARGTNYSTRVKFPKWRERKFNIVDHIDIKNR
jgi:hypothetical protein